jgi:HEAT repeat protein
MKVALFPNIGGRLRRLQKLAWWLGVCLLAGGTAVWWHGSRDPLQHALDRLLAAPLTIWRAPPETFDSFSDREMGLLLRGGTNCVPYLCRELRRHETAFNRFCLARWGSLPPFLTRILPEPLPVRARRLRAISLLQCLGQGAVRPAAGALIETLSDPAPEIAAQAASALGPVLSQSPRAREAFVAYFRRTQGGEFLGAEMWGGGFWKELPELLPQLVHQLEAPYLAGDAARALEAYGTNAAAAVPALIEVATEGFAGGYLKLEKTGRQPPTFGLLTESRCNALPALAKSGVRNQQVMETLFRAWNDPAFPMVRYNGGAALAVCGDAAKPLIPRLVATLEDEDGFTLTQKINALGQLGTLARAALPKLRAYESGHFPAGSPKEATDKEPIQFAATLAICRISNRDAAARLDRLATALAEREEAARCMGSLTDLASRILPMMRRRLREEDPRVAPRAAFVILRLAPNDTEARERLRAECESRDLIRRLAAARLLCEATGDVAHTLPVFLETLSRPELRFEAEEGLHLCGQAARPAVPRLLEWLWHPRGEVRRAAGDILREIAPERLPPINERSL